MKSALPRSTASRCHSTANASSRHARWNVGGAHNVQLQAEPLRDGPGDILLSCAIVPHQLHNRRGTSVSVNDCSTPSTTRTWLSAIVVGSGRLCSSGRSRVSR